MLNRKKGKKKHPRSSALRGLSTTFRVQPVDLPTPRTPSNTLGLDFEDSFEMSIGGAEWGLQQVAFDSSGISDISSSTFSTSLPDQCLYLNLKASGSDTDRDCSRSTGIICLRRLEALERRNSQGDWFLAGIVKKEVESNR